MKRWLFLLPLAIHAGFLAFYSVNVPISHDFSLLSAVEQMREGPTEFWNAFVAPDNEHRLGFARVLAFLTYCMTGKVNFNLMVFAAFGFWIIFYFRFLRAARISPHSAYGFMISTLFFSLSHWNYMFWATTCVSIYAVYLIAWITGELIVTPGRARFAGAAALSVFGALTFGSGLVTAPAAGLICAISKGRGKEAAAWLLLAIASFYFYFSFGMPREYVGPYYAEFFVPFVLFFFGSAFPTVFLPQIAGAISLIAAGLLAKRGAIPSLPVLFIMIFIAGNAVIIALSRGSMYPQIAIFERYVIHSLVFLSCLIAMFATTRIGKRKVFKAGGIALCSLLFVISIVRAYPHILREYAVRRDFYSEIYYFDDPDVAKRIVESARQKGLF